MNVKTIDIEFINDDYDEATEWFSKKLNKAYSFEYNNSNTIRDLFEYLMNKLSGDEIPIECDEYLQDHFYVKIGTSPVKVQLYFNLDEFLIINNISKLQLLYIFCPAGGAGAYDEEAGTIQINHERGKHIHIPHAHIYSGHAKKEKPFVRICLNNLTQMKGDSIKIKDILNKKQEEIIFGYLKNNKQKLIDFYDAVQRGEQVNPICLNYDGKQIMLK